MTSIALQSLKEDLEWKPGTKCDLYDRDIFKWVEAEIIGSFTKDNREWIKVRYAQSDRNVLRGGPELRQQDLLAGRELRQLWDAAVQIPVIAPHFAKGVTVVLCNESTLSIRLFALHFYIDVNMDR